MIKNLLFDFGGVLYNLDFKRTFSAFEAMGFSKFEDTMFSQYTADPLFQHLETGKISPEAFYGRIKQMAPQPVTNEQIRDAWNAMLINFRIPSLDFLVSLKEKYNLFLLSNTNQIHYDHFTRQLQQQTPYHSLNDFFTKAYYSHIIGLRKPDTEVFEFILQDAAIKAEETLFIDDSYTNFPNAEKLGMKIYLLEPGKLIENINYEQFNK
ncbi:HAD family hydrolase [Niabella aquatica]